jgi:hypothetical protein
MKKTIALLISFLLLFCLSSCATVKKDVEFSQDRTNVQSIEIYNPERAYYEGDIHTFLEENEPIVILEPEQHTSFLDTLYTLNFEKEVVFFPIPMDGGCDYDGYIIAVIYSDGGYDIIAARGLYSYAVSSDGKGRHKYDYSNYCGETPWAEFIEDYIEK